MPHAEIPMVVVTNEDRVNGAATMFYPGVMDEIGEKLGGNFFVLPSSLHEPLLFQTMEIWNIKHCLLWLRR